MDSRSDTFSLKHGIFLLGLATFLTGCASDAPQQSARFCDDSGCSERPLSSANADYLKRPTSVKSEQILKLEQVATTDPRAAYDLALRYFRGDGVQRNSYQAIEWMRKAGYGGLLDAQKALGGYYLGGFEEMGSDPQEAEKWLSMAAAQGDKESAALLPRAAEAKRQEAENYRLREEWREYYRNYWYHTYTYFTYWQSDSWYYY